MKNLVLAVVVVGVLYFGYKFFFATGGAELVVDGGGEGQLVASEFLIKLNELQSINFSSDLFSDARFNSFQSFSTAPDPVESGRANPFSR